MAPLIALPALLAPAANDPVTPAAPAGQLITAAVIWPP